jgi:hypothetical protein
LLFKNDRSHSDRCGPPRRILGARTANADGWLLPPWTRAIIGCKIIGAQGVRSGPKLGRPSVPIAVPPPALGLGFILVFSSDQPPYLGSLRVLLGGHRLRCRICCTL